MKSTMRVTSFNGDFTDYRKNITYRILKLC